MAGLTRYNNEDKVIDTQKIVTSTWSSNTNNANAFAVFSSSGAGGVTPTASAAFFIEIFNTASTSVTKEPQYAVAYGHKKGSGSLDFTNDTGDHGNSGARVIFNQYRQLIYGDETSDFNFEGTTPDSIYVININRARYKHNLKPGSLNLTLSGSNAHLTAGELHLTDDSATTSGSATITNAGRQFNLVSVSSGVMLGTTLAQTDSGSYGFFYPDSGFIILNPRALSMSIAISESVGSNLNNHNHHLFKNSISGGNSFVVDSEEKVT